MGLENVPGILGWAAAGYLGLLALLYAAQRSLLYHPTKVAPDPIRFGVPEMQTVRVSTTDGLKLHCWWRPPAREDRATIVYFHGNAGHIGDRAFKARHFLNAGYGVLLVSYRYNADGGGRPSEAALYKDGRAAYRFVHSQGVPDDRIALYGESLGSGVATKVASERPVGAVILEAPYTSIPDVAQKLYWYAPAKWLLHDRFESIGRIDRVNAPLLILHGEADALIPVAFAKKLFAAAVEPKEAHFLPGGGHADLYDFGADRIVIEFLNRKLARSL